MRVIGRELKKKQTNTALSVLKDDLIHKHLSFNLKDYKPTTSQTSLTLDKHIIWLRNLWLLKLSEGG